MSKFIDNLELVSEGGLPPLGFRAGGAKPRPKMLLVARLAAGAAKADVAGADAVIVSIPKAGAKAPKASGKSAIPWGGWLQEVTEPGVKRLAEAGADFAVFPSGSLVQPLLEAEKLGKIVAVAPDLEAGLLRAADDLPVNAVIIADEASSLSWEKLMLCRRCVNLLSKPVLVTVSPDIAAGELQALCEAGVAGVVVASTELDGLRRAIDKLTSPKAAKRRRAEPLLPRMGGGDTIAAPEEEEEDED